MGLLRVAFAGSLAVGTPVAAAPPRASDAEVMVAGPRERGWNAPPGANRYRHRPPTTPVALKSYLDEPSPDVLPRGWSAQDPLTISAAPSEREPASVLVFSDERARRLDVEVTRLRGPVSLPSSVVEISTVRRVETRRRFNRNDTEVIGRFLTRFVPHQLGAREFEELWLNFRVPPGTVPGVYRGAIRIRLGPTWIERELRLRVRPIGLEAPRGKALGVYYRMVRKLVQIDGNDRVARELEDLVDHGIAHLVLDLRPFFSASSSQALAIDTRMLERGLALVERAGFRGTVVVDSGLVPLARRLGHRGIEYAGAGGPKLDSDFDLAAVEVLTELARVAKRHPALDLAVVHLDEIFDHSRLDAFLRMSRLTRETTSLPVYATFSTLAPGHEDLRSLIDPFVDLRSHHGYSFEWWLARGASMQGYARELERSGDRAWYYHNERGTYFTARWARLVNGLYLWASPFEAHVTWTYQQFDGSPLDDTDGRMHDFGLAFPDPDEPRVLVPTRGWEALAQGYDDLRYLATLEGALERHGPAAPGPAREASTFLDELRRDLQTPPTDIDPDRLPTMVGTPREAPFVRAAAERYDGPALALIRERCEEYTRALVTAGHHPPGEGP